MKATLAALEADLEDLEESVKYVHSAHSVLDRNHPTNNTKLTSNWIIKFALNYRIVESTGARMFGLDDTEVMERRRYVGHVRREIEVRGA